MRYGFGFHHHEHWMGLMWIGPLLWLIVLGLLVWFSVRFMRRTTLQTPTGGFGVDRRETPEEVLDRRFASGEIDAEAHAAARQHLKDHPRS
jgi:putative membrane protein